MNTRQLSKTRRLAQTIVGLREFRENLPDYISEIKKGRHFTVVRRSEPIFDVKPIEEDEFWEPVVDFTKLKKGGVNIKEILSRL